MARKKYFIFIYLFIYFFKVLLKFDKEGYLRALKMLICLELNQESRFLVCWFNSHLAQNIS